MEDQEDFTRYFDIKGRQYPDVSVRPCPHPAVIKKYGFNGHCNVSVWVCKKCNYSERDPHMDAYGCTFAVTEQNARNLHNLFPKRVKGGKKWQDEEEKTMDGSRLAGS